MEQQALYNIKPQKPLFIIVLFLVMIIVLTYAISKYTYDKKEIVGLSNCDEKECSIKLTLTYNEVEILNQNPKILYEKKEYKIKEMIYDEPYLSNNIPVNDITLKTDHITNNKIIDFQLIYNKERIITKIKNIIERS